MLEIIFLCVSIGVIAGLLAGMFGVGGGLIIVPFLVAIFELQGVDASIHMPLALGSSLATILVTGVSSTLSHHRRGAVEWQAVKRMAPLLTLGCALGAMVASALPSTNLKLGFAIGELLVAANMLRPKKAYVGEAKLATPKLMVGGSLIGFVSAFGGIGGATFNVPFLSSCGLAMQRAVATAAACGVPVALGGAIGYMASGWSNSLLPPYSLGFLYWPAVLGVVSVSALVAPLGVWLAHRLPATVLKKMFALLLASLGVTMLLI